MATVCHAIEAGPEAHTKPFYTHQAENVIRIARWFAQERMLVLGMLRSDRKFQRFEKLCAILSSQPGRRSTLNDLKRRNGFQEEEVRSLAKEFHHKLQNLLYLPPEPQRTASRWRQLSRGDSMRAITTQAAIFVIETVTVRIFGLDRAAKMEIEFDEGQPKLRDVHSAIEELCGPLGWEVLVGLGDTEK